MRDRSAPEEGCEQAVTASTGYITGKEKSLQEEMSLHLALLAAPQPKLI